MIRATLAIMSGLLCALAGARYAASLKADAVRIRRWVTLLRHLALLLQEGTLSIPEALCAAADDVLPPDKLLRAMAASLAASPLLTAADAYARNAGDSREKAALTRMFQRLSHGSKESRILAVEQAAEEVTLLAEAAAARAEKDVKLWQTLGLTGGICLTILLM